MIIFFLTTLLIQVSWSLSELSLGERCDKLYPGLDAGYFHGIYRNALNQAHLRTSRLFGIL